MSHMCTSMVEGMMVKSERVVVNYTYLIIKLLGCFTITEICVFGTLENICNKTNTVYWLCAFVKITAWLYCIMFVLNDVE